LTFEKSSGSLYLKEILRDELMATLNMAEERGESLDKFIQTGYTYKWKWLKISCESFLKFKEEMEKFFKIDVGKVAAGLEETHPFKHYLYANLHCKTVVEAAEKAAAGKRKSVMQRLRCLSRCP
jgi:hypothetical protein